MVHYGCSRSYTIVMSFLSFRIHHYGRSSKHKSKTNEAVRDSQSQKESGEETKSWHGGHITESRHCKRASISLSQSAWILLNSLLFSVALVSGFMREMYPGASFCCLLFLTGGATARPSCREGFLGTPAHLSSQLRGLLHGWTHREKAPRTVLNRSEPFQLFCLNDRAGWVDRIGFSPLMLVVLCPGRNRFLGDMSSLGWETQSY